MRQQCNGFRQFLRRIFGLPASGSVTIPATGSCRNMLSLFRGSSRFRQQRAGGFLPQFELLEARITPAEVFFVAVSKTISFFADPGEANNITVSIANNGT